MTQNHERLPKLI